MRMNGILYGVTRSKENQFCGFNLNQHTCIWQALTVYFVNTWVCGCVYKKKKKEKKYSNKLVNTPLEFTE